MVRFGTYSALENIFSALWSADMMDKSSLTFQVARNAGYAVVVEEHHPQLGQLGKAVQDEDHVV